MKEGILRQPFGYCSVEVEVIQSIEAAGNEVMLHPFMKKTDVQQLLTYLQLPYEMEEKIVPFTKRSITPLHNNGVDYKCCARCADRRCEYIY